MTTVTLKTGPQWRAEVDRYRTAHSDLRHALISALKLPKHVDDADIVAAVLNLMTTDVAVEPEWRPRAGLRATGIDLDGRTVTGMIVSFFAWNNENGGNDRARLQADGITSVVTTASLRPAVDEQAVTGDGS